MPLPKPEPGLIVHYAYLWHDQARAGLEEGTKDRPCLILSVLPKEAGRSLVTVAPITHAPPAAGSAAIEIPPLTKRRLGMDTDASWILAEEVNLFYWPGLDLRRIPGRKETKFDYGFIPPALLTKVHALIRGRLERHLLKSTGRS